MEDHSEKIQDYIEGLLVGEELSDFEARMKEDKELRNLVSLQREVYEILSGRVNSKEAEIRQTLSDVNKKYQSTPQNKERIKKWFPAVAAACILLIGSLFFFKGSDKLYELPLMRSEIVRGAEENTAYEKAVRAFNEMRYATAREQLLSLLDEQPEQVQYQYYLALTYIGDKKWAESIDHLTPIANGPTVFSLEANYYLALAYYEKGDSSSSKMCLNKIPEEGKLEEKVKALRKKMD